jgi:hypothetical protein
MLRAAEPNMSPDLKFAYESGCLVVHSRGRYLIEHRETAIKAIAKAAKARPIRAVLVDMRALKGPFKFVDRYQLGELCARYLNFVPVGCLVLPEQPDPERIGQIVANNRGAKVEIFTDEAGAHGWLKQFQTAGNSAP